MQPVNESSAQPASIAREPVAAPSSRLGTVRPHAVSIRAAQWSMRIVEEHWEYALGAVSEIGGLVISVRDEEGNEGFGYATAVPFDGETVESLIGAVGLIGRSTAWRDLTLLEARDRWDRIVYSNQRAKAGLELAVIDLIGRRANVPAHEVLGYGPGRVRTHAVTRILALDTPDAMRRRAQELVDDEGARGIKIKAEGDVAVDGARVREIRTAVGADVALVVDANQSYTPKGAIQFGRILDECSVAVFEQPVGRQDLDGLRQVREAVDCLVEADESAATISDVLLLAQHQSVDAISVKLPKMGGLVRCLQIAQLCRQVGLGFRVGSVFGSRIYEAASAHLLACVESNLPHELAEPEHLLPDPFPSSFLEDGRLALPLGPGLGTAAPAIAHDGWDFSW